MQQTKGGGGCVCMSVFGPRVAGARCCLNNVALTGGDRPRGDRLAKGGRKKIN